MRLLRQGRWALLIGLLVHLLFLLSLRGQFLNSLFIEAEHAYGQAGDYFGIYQAGDNLVHGRSIYDSADYLDEADRRVPYFYFYRYLPPTAYLFGLISLVLSPWAGYWNWVVFNELLLALLFFWILRLEAFPIRTRRFYASLWLGFFPFYLEQWMGQFSFLMAAFLWILMSDCLPGAPGKTCAEEGLQGRALRAWIASVILKSYTALFAVSYLRRRRLRPVLACAGAVVLASAPYYIARPEDLRQFLLLNFRPLPPGVHGGTLGASAFVRMLGWCLPEGISGRLLDFRIFDVYAGNVPVFVVSVLIILSTLSIVLTRGRRVPLHLQIALWVLAFFLVFKDVWEYHYVMLLPIVTAIGLASGSRLVLWMALLLALPTPYRLFADDGSLSLGANLLHHASKAIPTYVLFLWTLRKGMAHEGGEIRT